MNLSKTNTSLVNRAFETVAPIHDEDLRHEIACALNEHPLLNARMLMLLKDAESGGAADGKTSLDADVLSNLMMIGFLAGMEYRQQMALSHAVRGVCTDAVNEALEHGSSQHPDQAADILIDGLIFDTTSGTELLTQ